VTRDLRQELLTLTAAPNSKWPFVVPLVVVCVMGAALTLGVLGLQRSVARADANTTVDRQVHEIATRATESLAILNGSVTTLAGWLAINPTVSEARFITLSERAIGTRTDLQSLEYAPVVRAADRAEFEQMLAKRGHGGGIQEPGPNGLQNAAQRNMYLPLEYVAPAGDLLIHGLDALARPENQSSILRAVATGRTVIGQPMTLVEDGQLALLTYTPIYSRESNPRTVLERKRQWTGTVIGVLRLDDWITDAVAQASPEEYQLGLVGLPGGEQLWSNTADPSGDVVATAGITWDESQILELQGSPGPSGSAAFPAWRGAATAGVGLLLTLTLALATWKWLQERASRKRAEVLERRSQELQLLAETDPLTGLLHRDGLRRWLREWLAANGQRPLALVFIDLNNFKEINSVVGHVAGDLVLEQVGHRLSVLTVDTDTVVGRMGGDQFVVMRAGDRGSLSGLVSLLQSMISEPLRAGDADIELTSSLGVAYYPDDGKDLDSLMLHADLAVQEAKKQPGNSATHFHPVLVAKGQRQRKQALALRMALRDPDEHFELEYQPQVDLLTGRVVGAEALLRWRQQDGSLLHPGEFLALATHQGLMPALGEWVLDCACQTLAAWPDEYRVVVAVNVEAQQIRRAFASSVKRIVARRGVDPARITLEVTEAAAMDPGARAQLDVLRAEGMGIAIDDFGTGFSSLSRLTEVPACELKSDRVFIANLGQKAEALDIVQAFHALATALSLNVVAEGVETPEQAQILVNEGVRIAQGFLFSPGVPDEQFQRLCEQGFPAFDLRAR
jgi:diguanylate cyclase (GGDEF)-like protein